MSEFHLYGEPATVDAVIHIGSDTYVLARNDNGKRAAKLRAGTTFQDEFDAPEYVVDTDE